MKSLKRKVGRPENEIPSVKKSVCISGENWNWLKKEAKRISKSSGCRVSELSVMYGVIDMARQKSEKKK